MAKLREVISIPGMPHGAPIPNGAKIGNMVFSSAISVENFYLVGKFSHLDRPLHLLQRLDEMDGLYMHHVEGLIRPYPAN